MQSCLLSSQYSKTCMCKGVYRCCEHVECDHPGKPIRFIAIYFTCKYVLIWNGLQASCILSNKAVQCQSPSRICIVNMLSLSSLQKNLLLILSVIFCAQLSQTSSIFHMSCIYFSSSLSKAFKCEYICLVCTLATCCSLCLWIV